MITIKQQSFNLYIYKQEYLIYKKLSTNYNEQFVHESFWIRHQSI